MPHLTPTAAATSSPIAATTAAAAIAAGSSVASCSSKRREDHSTRRSKSSNSSRVASSSSIGSAAQPSRGASPLASPQQQQSTNTTFQRREDGGEEAFKSPTARSTRTTASTSSRNRSSTSSRGGGSLVGEQQQQQQQPSLDLDPLPVVVGLSGAILSPPRSTSSNASLGNGSGRRSKLRLPLSPTRTDLADDKEERGGGERGESRSLPSHGGRHLKKYSSPDAPSNKNSSTVSIIANIGQSPRQSQQQQQQQQRVRSLSDPPHKSATIDAVDAAAAGGGGVSSPASTTTRSSPSPSISSSRSKAASSSLRSKRRSRTILSPSGGSAASTSLLSARYAHSPKLVASSPPSTPPIGIATGMDNAAASSSSPNLTAAASGLQTPCIADDVTTNSVLLSATASLANGGDDDDEEHHHPAKNNTTTTTNNNTISTVERFIDILNEKQELLNILKPQKSDLQQVESRSTMSPIHSTALRQHHYHGKNASESDMEGIVSLLDDATLADLSRYIDAIQTKEDGSSSIMMDDDDDMEHHANNDNNDGSGMGLMSTVENLGKLSSPRAAVASDRDRGSKGISSHKKSSSSSSHRLEDTLAVVQDFIDSKKQQQEQHPVDISAVQSKSFSEGDADNIDPAALAAVSSVLDALVNVREARRSTTTTTTTSGNNDDHHSSHSISHDNRSVVDPYESNSTRHKAVSSGKLILVNSGPANAAAATGHKLILVNTGPSHLRDGGDEKTAATEEVSVTDNSTAAGAGAASNKGAATSSSSSSSNSRVHSTNRASGNSSSSRRGDVTTSSRASASSRQSPSKTNGTSAATTSQQQSSNQEPTNTTPATPPTTIGSVNETAVGVNNSSHRGGTSSGSRASASSLPRSDAHGTTTRSHHSSNQQEPNKTPTTTAARSRQSKNQHHMKPPGTLDLVEGTTSAVVGIPSVDMAGSSDVVSLLGSLASTPKRSIEEERLYKQLSKASRRRRRDDSNSISTEDLPPETLAMIETYIASIQSGSASPDVGDDIIVPTETSNGVSDFIDRLTARKEGKHEEQQKVKSPVSIRVKKDPPTAFELELEKKEKKVVKVSKDPPIKDTLSAEFERYVSGNREPEINPAKHHREPPTCTRSMNGKDDTRSGQLVDPELHKSLVVTASGEANGDSVTQATQASTVVRASETNRDLETPTTQGSIFSRSSRRKKLGKTRASTGNNKRETTPVEPEIIALLSDDADDLSTSSTDSDFGLRDDDSHLITDLLELSSCASSSNYVNLSSSEGHSALTKNERENGTGGAANVNRHVQTKPGADSSLGFDSRLKATRRNQPPSPEAKHRIRSPHGSPVRNNQVSHAVEKKKEDNQVEDDSLLENEVFRRLSDALKIPNNDIYQQRALAVVARNAFPHFKAAPPTPAKLYEIRAEADEIGLSSEVAGRFIQLAQAQLKNRLDRASPDDHLEAKARKHPHYDSAAHDADIIAFLCRVLKMAPVIFKSIQEESSTSGPFTSGPSRASSPSQQSSVQEAFEVDLEHGLLEEKTSVDSEDEGPWWEAAAKLTSKSWQYYASGSEDESDQEMFSDSERSSSIDQRRTVGKRTPETLALADLSESRSEYTSAGENMMMCSPTNRPMSNRSDADEEMNYFWRSQQEMRERRSQFRNRNRKSYVRLPNSFSHTTMEESSLPSRRRLRAGASYESTEEAWLVKRSMARWGRNTPWNDPKVLFSRNKETLFPVQDPKPINGVDSAKSLYAASAIWKSRRPSGLGCQWYQSYGFRTQGHTGYFDIDVFSLYEASVTRARRHPQDKVAWEYRCVKQRFLYEQSINYCRNWFGDLDAKHAAPIIEYPICRPKSMEMPMKAPEWSPEWYRGPYLAPLGSNLSGASLEEAIPGYLRDELEEYDQDAWEETPECGTLRNTQPQLKCGERITLVTPDLVSSLRRSRWRKKFFPRGTFPYG